MSDVADVINNRLGRDLSEFISDTVAEAFRHFDKVATGRTIRSIRTTYEVRPNGSIIFETTIANSSLFISRGRAPQLDEDGNERISSRPPIENIIEWMVARNIKGDPYAIARSINVEGIQGVDIIGYSQDRIVNKVRELLFSTEYKQLLSNQLLTELRSIIKSVN